MHRSFPQPHRFSLVRPRFGSGWRRLLLAAVVLGLLATGAAPPLVAAPQSEAQAQDGTAAEVPRDRARSLGDEGRWEESVAAWRAVVLDNPSDPLARLELAGALQELGRLDEARAALEEADRLGAPPGPVEYRRARLHAAAGEIDAAFVRLERLVAGGFPRADLLQAEDDFAPLRDDPRWAALLERIDATVRPCAHDPAYRALDFWVGEWDVYANGRQAGESRVELILEECVVFENWSGRGGLDGKSFNLYHAPTGVWRQTWVNDRGTLLEFRGEPVDGELVYRGESTRPDGTAVLDRMRLIPVDADRVRQLWEQSADAGETWSVTFDGLYVRRGSGASPVLEETGDAAGEATGDPAGGAEGEAGGR